MMAKIRTARFFKLKTRPDELRLGYSGRAAMIARIHQFGRTVRNRRGRKSHYPQRVLLGVTRDDLRTLAQHLTTQMEEIIR